MLQSHPTTDAPANQGFHPHAQAVEACLDQMQSSALGLDQAEAAERLAKDGPNALPEARGLHPVLRFLSHFHNALIYVLLASSVVTALLDHWIDTVVILAVVLVNAIVGFIQEGRAENAMAAIRSMLAPHARVIRGGARLDIAAEDIVCGDVVALEAGDQVPADLRLLDARSLRIEEAVLTGESVPVSKDTKAVATEAALGDRKSMAFSGTTVATGTGRGVVVATALNTEIGRISGMLRDVSVLTTPLVAQMGRFTRWLTVMILILASAMLGFGIFVSQIPFDEMFMAVVGLTVAAIPEGLPAVLTITLAIGVQQMAKRNVIVRKLPAIETLGAVSVICSDKTGTLTRNEMMVASLALAEGQHQISGEGYAPMGTVEPSLDANAKTSLSIIAGLCNDAALHEEEDRWTVTGDPMEGALLSFAQKLMPDQDHQHWRRLDEIPFDSAHRYMAVLVEEPNGNRHILVKGAPERLLSMCQEQARGDQSAPLDRGYWPEAANQIAGQGQRVLALAHANTTADTLSPEALTDNLRFIGLVGLMDPPRTEAISAIANCHDAGIAVKMITGDHAGTAAAIGRQIGLKHADQVLTGDDIEQLSDADLAQAVMGTNIFARTSPEHKLRLVSALQAQGLTVAMTGDGVNDAPALKRADAGVAMGIKGSDAAKSAAELVLTDDNFASIAAAVREGRTVFDNLRKVISWTLPTNAGEAGTIIAALLLGLSLPISPVQILWVNLITAVTLGLALAFEPTEPGTMKRAPRPRSAPLLGGQLVWQVLFVGGLFTAAVFGLYLYSINRGYSEELAQGMSMNMLVILEIFYLFFIRNLYGSSLNWQAIKGTKAVWSCLTIIVPAQFLITYFPPAQAIMGTASINLIDGMLMIGIGIVFFAVIEVEKQMRLALTNRHR